MDTAQKDSFSTWISITSNTGIQVSIAATATTPAKAPAMKLGSTWVAPDLAVVDEVGTGVVCDVVEVTLVAVTLGFERIRPPPTCGGAWAGTTLATLASL